jgi:hypothetical protein
VDPDQKEILFWSGGAILALLLGLTYLISLRGEVRRIDRKVNDQVAVYQKFYRVDADDVGRDPALTWRRSLAEAQGNELRLVEDQMLVQLPAKVPTADERLRVINWTQDTLTALISLATRQNLSFIDRLPFRDDRPKLSEDPAVLKVQILQVFAMDRILRQLIAAGPRKIDECYLHEPYHDPDGAYLVVPFRISLVADNEVLDRILRELSIGEKGINATQILTSPEGKGLYRLAMKVCLVVRRGNDMVRIPAGTVPTGTTPADAPTSPPGAVAPGTGGTPEVRGSGRPASTDRQP